MAGEGIQSQLPKGPAGATGASEGPDGTLQYHDISGKVLGAVPGDNGGAAADDIDLSAGMVPKDDGLDLSAGMVPKTAAAAPPSSAHKPLTGALGVLNGIGGEVLETAQGAKELVNKVLPNSMQIPDIPKEYRENVTPSEKIGGFAESVGEFATGEELVKSLSRFAKLEKLAAGSPTIAKFLTETPDFLKRVVSGAAKAGTVGGAQGAVKGAAEGDAKSGAEAGAIGGVVGGASGEAIGPGLKTLGKAFGLGLDSEEALVRGVKPSVGEDANFRTALKTAAPRIAEAAETSPVKTVSDFEDLLHNKAQDIRKNEFGPMIQRHADEMVSAKPIADSIRSAISDQMREYTPKEAKEVENFANKFSKDMPLGKAESDLQFFNAQLKKFYKASAVDQNTALRISGTVAKYEAAADGLRDVIYGRLRELGEDAPEELQRQYGALKTLERSVAKRATVSERQNPLNITEIMGLLAGAGEMGTAIASGHPMAAVAGVLPYAAAKTAKVLNSSDSLVKRGVKTVVKEAAGPAEATGAGAAAKTVGAAAASQAAQWIRVKDSNGQEWQVHPDDLSRMQSADPGVTQVQ